MHLREKGHFQSGIICVVFVLENLLYFLPGGRGLQFTTIAQTWMDITLHTMHAVVIFSFNNLARDILKSLIRGKVPKIASVMPTTFVGTRVSPVNTITKIRAVNIIKKIASSKMYHNASKT